jgi:hypothetical protein
MTDECERLTDDVQHVMMLCGLLEGHADTAIGALETIDLDDLRQRLDKLNRPATAEEIASYVQRFVEFFVRDGNLQRYAIYAQVLTQDLCAEEPTLLALGYTLGTFRRAPCLAEILKTLKGAQTGISEARETLGRTPAMVAQRLEQDGARKLSEILKHE